MQLSKCCTCFEALKFFSSKSVKRICLSFRWHWGKRIVWPLPSTRPTNKIFFYTTSPTESFLFTFVCSMWIDSEMGELWCSTHGISCWFTTTGKGKNMPAVASLRVKRSCCSTLIIFIVPIRASFSAKQQNPQMQQGPYPSPSLVYRSLWRKPATLATTAGEN